MRACVRACVRVCVCVCVNNDKLSTSGTSFPQICFFPTCSILYESLLTWVVLCRYSQWINSVYVAQWTNSSHKQYMFTVPSDRIDAVIRHEY